MKNSISKLLFTVLIFAFLSCNEDSSGPQVIENDNDESHFFALEKGQSFDYDQVNAVIDYSKEDTTRTFIRRVTFIVGSEEELQGKTGNIILDNKFLEESIFSQASHVRTDEEGLEFYMDNITVAGRNMSNYSGQWLKAIDFKNFEWDIASGIDTILGEKSQIEYRLYGKRINVVDILYKKNLYDALNVEVILFHKITRLNGSSDEIIDQKKFNILSVRNLGIFQLQHPVGVGLTRFSILSDDE